MVKAFESAEKEKTCATGVTCKHQKCDLLESLFGGMPLGKILKAGPLRVHFQHSGVKIIVFEQNTNIIKFWLF